MDIKGTEGLSEQDINRMLQNGARFVVYKYCISIVVMTFQRSSDIHFIPPGESSVTKGLPYVLLSLVLGWWGIPWGPVHTIGSLYTNLSGGKDVTNEVTMAVLGVQ